MVLKRKAKEVFLRETGIGLNRAKIEKEDGEGGKETIEGPEPHVDLV